MKILQVLGVILLLAGVFIILTATVLPSDFSIGPIRVTAISESAAIRLVVGIVILAVGVVLIMGKSSWRIFKK